ncbi:hypothetical protein EON83_24825 [bacterium]|nr:MAG: hypothetical protein EON83_24825 [bacterium]
MDSEELPEWINVLFDQISSAIEFKGLADIAWRYLDPESTYWGIDVLEIAPALMDLSQLGAEEGEFGYGIIHNLDLLEIQKAFQEVSSMSFGIENEDKSCITIEGTANNQQVMVFIYTEPFDDSYDEAEEQQLLAPE